MTDPSMSRRSFLGAAGGAALAALGASSASALLSGSPAAAARPAISPLVLSADLYATGAPQRFAFAVARGRRYASFGDAAVAFAPRGGRRGPFVAARLYRRGLPRGRGVYVVDATFPEPGVWDAVLRTGGRTTPFAVQVKEQAEAPVVGAPAPRAPSPTTTASLGVDPICTRRPACPLHDSSLSDVLGAGTPAAVMFATPALCQSQYCGPVLDQLLELRGRYGDAIRMVHVEIYRSTKGATVAPTVEAWGLPSEPWLFTVDAGGTIVGRLDGAFGRQEIARRLDALVA